MQTLLSAVSTEEIVSSLVADTRLQLSFNETVYSRNDYGGEPDVFKTDITVYLWCYQRDSVQRYSLSLYVNGSDIFESMDATLQTAIEIIDNLRQQHGVEPSQEILDHAERMGVLDYWRDMTRWQYEVVSKKQ